MSELLASTLTHLQHLVAFDTRNPPRNISTGGIFNYIRHQLPDFKLWLHDYGAGAVSLLAVRGAPKYLFNVHLDTVPDAPGWSCDPLRLRVDSQCAIGLGTCDIKGAAAGLLAAAQHSRGDMAVLFSSDEEANDARCINAFLKSEHAFMSVVVAEPTRCQAVLAHRGISAVQLQFKGQAGHGSSEHALDASALHHAMRWGVAALDYVKSQSHLRFSDLSGLRFNIGKVQGGIKANMIASRAEVRFGFRPLPSQEIDGLHRNFGALAAEGVLARYEETFRGPPLPAGHGDEAEPRRLEAHALARHLGLPVGNAVDFWTEASLFSRAGLTALVFGPGDIAQAHTANEWVALSQLESYAKQIARMIEHANA